MPYPASFSHLSLIFVVTVDDRGIKKYISDMAPPINIENHSQHSYIGFDKSGFICCGVHP